MCFGVYVDDGNTHQISEDLKPFPFVFGAMFKNQRVNPWSTQLTNTFSIIFDISIDE